MAYDKEKELVIPILRGSRKGCKEIDDFNIIASENGITDVEYSCTENHSLLTSLTWCEDNCNKYSFCQRIADANDFLAYENK